MQFSTHTPDSQISRHLLHTINLWGYILAALRHPKKKKKKKSSNNYPKTITPVNFAPCPLVYSKKFPKTKLEFESDSLILQGNDQTLTLLYYSYRIDEQKNDFGDIN